MDIISHMGSMWNPYVHSIWNLYGHAIWIAHMDSIWHVPDANQLQLIVAAPIPSDCSVPWDRLMPHASFLLKGCCHVYHDSTYRLRLSDDK